MSSKNSKASLGNATAVDSQKLIQKLIKMKYLHAGVNSLYINYLNKTICCDLLPEGVLKFRGQIYTSPTACSVAMKKTVKPQTKGMSGWLCVYSSESKKSLSELRSTYLQSKKAKAKSLEIKSNRRASTLAATSNSLAPIATKPHSRKISEVTSDPYPDENSVKSQNKKANHEIKKRGRKRLKVSKASTSCRVCELNDNPSLMLLCDACNGEYHLSCLSPPLTLVPDGSWFCEQCLDDQEKKTVSFLYVLKSVINKLSGDEETKISMMRQFDELVHSIEDRSTRVDVLANSTGEVLAHISLLDFPVSIGSLIDKLQAIGSKDEEKAKEAMGKFCRESWPAGKPHDLTSRKLIHIFDIYHRVLNGTDMYSRQTAALLSRSKNRLSDCTVKAKKLESDREKEQSDRIRLAERVAQLKEEIPLAKEQIEKDEFLLESIRKLRQHLHDKIVREVFVPAYEKSMDSVQRTETQFFDSVVSSKAEEVIHAVEKWREMTNQYKSSYSKLCEKFGLSGSRSFLDGELQGDTKKAMSVLPVPPTKAMARRQMIHYSDMIQKLEDKQKKMMASLLVMKKLYLQPRRANYPGLLGRIDDLLRGDVVEMDNKHDRLVETNISKAIVVSI